MRGGGRQTNIASFFGGKAKGGVAMKSTQLDGHDENAYNTQAGKDVREKDDAVVDDDKKPSSNDSGQKTEDSAAKRKVGSPTAASGDMQAPTKMKRLRKSRKNELTTDQTAEQESKNIRLAVENMSELEDSDTDDQPDLAAKEANGETRGDESANLREMDALRKAAAAEDLISQSKSESESKDIEIDLSSGDEGTSSKKKAAKSPIKAKVDGVGSLAIKAAARHGTFQLEKLATWTPGKPVPFSFLADTFEAIADESKRLIITSLLVNAFRAVIATSPDDLLPMIYLCTNRVAPAHEGLELGIGDASLIKALSQATGRKESIIKSDYDSSGDLGVVAAASRATQRTMFAPPPLTISGVFKSFKEIAMAEGSKSQDRKRSLIVKLLVSAKENEAGYVMRALQGKLRIGLAEQTVLVALAHASLLQRNKSTLSADELAGELEKASQIVKSVYSECPSYDELVPALLSDMPIEELPSKVYFKPGVPIKPMLAKPTTGVSEVLDKFSDQPFTCEYKYDGERAQIHVLDNGSVKIYSRNSEDNSTKYPDIAALFPKVLATGVKSIVLDAEAVAYDTEANKVLPFQVLSTRARKDVSIDNIKVPVCVFAFDCLYVDGMPLLHKSLTERREALYAAIKPIPGKFEFAIAKTSSDVEELSAFLDESVEAGTEGLIVKTMNDSYEPSKRSSHWLKLKKDYLDGVGDTFDLVPIGAWFGRGKRTGVFGSYLLAVYDPENEEYQSITKIGTGFSEELLKQLADQMNGCTVDHPPHYYRTPETLTPDVWFEPKAVWEVKAADLSISPAHRAAAGLVDESKGISIRFPRLVRVRDDKGPEDSTSPEQIADMYRQQAVLQGKKSTLEEE